MADWYYQVMGEAVGPVLSKELRGKAIGGEVQKDTLVRKGAEGKWVSAIRVKGLFDGIDTPAESPEAESAKVVPLEGASQSEPLRDDATRVRKRTIGVGLAVTCGVTILLGFVSKP